MDKTTFSEPDNILLKVISGSRAYGLHTEMSDTDIRGVFAASRVQLFGFDTPMQVNNDSNDIVFFELKKFVDLLLKNNPNMLELLASPEDCIISSHPLMNRFGPELFLSKLCHQSFAGYAQSQIKKARGLNKKIVNPISKEKKTILDFCFVSVGQGSILFKTWLNEHNFQADKCGLVRIPHMRDVYGLYHESQWGDLQLSGIISGDDARDVRLSSVPKGLNPLTLFSFNKDGYSKYCRDYKEYWEWTRKRNDERFQNTLDHEKNYDAKNMMHTFRLLAMAEEIGRYGEIRVRRVDREYLLGIRSGHYEYEELLAMANEKILAIGELFEKSSLPDIPDSALGEQLLIEIREEFFTSSRIVG